MSGLRRLLAYEPAVLAWAANGGLAVILAWAMHLSTVQMGAITTIATALAAGLTAAQTRPVAVPALTGALATIVTALAAFGLHLPPTVIGAGVGLVSTILGLVFRANVTPLAATRSTNS